MTVLLGNELSLYAETVILKEFEFKNSDVDCKQTNSCSLKAFRLQVEETEIVLKESDEKHFISKMVASYETESLDTLKDYVIVQFIRGCRFESKMVDGKLQKKDAYEKIMSFGEFKDFHFPDWVIDSQDKCPVYNSAIDREAGQKLLHYLYRWNTTKGSFRKETQKFYGLQKPEEPALYVKELLSGAFYLNNGGTFHGTAFNNSLELRTCIFKTRDVPRETRRDDIQFATPLKCFDWRVSKVFNHVTKEFESPSEIDAFCLQP
jgi:hypothetical protein